MSEQDGASPLPSRRLVISEPAEALRWLRETFGVTFEPFDIAADKARMEWGTRTEFDPPYLPGSIFAGTHVRYLRVELIPKNWTYDNPHNFARTIHPSGTACIVVETGDENAGVLAVVPPKTKSAKGAVITAAVTVNRDQLDLFLPLVPTVHSVEQKAEKMLTYFLLVRLERGRIYRELSLPVQKGDDDRVDDWHIRVLLPPLDRGGDPPRIKLPLPEQGPPPDISILRKTA